MCLFSSSHIGYEDVFYALVNYFTASKFEWLTSDVLNFVLLML